MTQLLLNSSIKSLPLIVQGKVRDIYDVDNNKLMIVTTDRLSAFDVIIPTPIAFKGEVLTRISNFWFNHLANIVPNHLTGIAPESVIKDVAEQQQIQGRAIVVQKLKPLPIEAVVRGYLAGSAWKEYQQHGTVCGLPLPNGLQEAAHLAEPIFTPSTKAEIGAHDENISFEKTVDLIGLELAEKVRKTAIALYKEASKHAVNCGIVIADTKFEFGLDDAGDMHLIDEALTPDSSRFWPIEQYKTGSSPPSFDKQFVRDWLETSGWNKQSPAPELPPEIASKTSDKYREALRKLTGTDIQI